VSAIVVTSAVNHRRIEEIMEVLKLCTVQGVQACNLGVPILAEEAERQPETKL
jgi:hypothetical protein